MIVVLAVAVRIKSQGDPRLSVATDDTSSYIASSGSPLFSWEAFSGQRLFTTNLVYKLLKPDQGYKILVNGSGNTRRRQIQPDFVYVVVLQFILSVICWVILALSVSKRIHHPILKILATILILAFAFVPQIADWDSILSSESLSFSLFALQAGLLIELVFRFAYTFQIDLKTFWLIVMWLVIVFFWTFLRDAHIFGVFLTILLIVGVVFLNRFTGQRNLVAILFVLAMYFLLGLITSGNSVRAVQPMANVYYANILTSPVRVEIMQKYGMPFPESQEFNEWFPINAKRVYIKFMLFHPGYVVSGYFKDIPLAFYENIQPYFHTGKVTSLRGAVIPFGDMLHSLAVTPVLVDLILLFAVLMNVFYKNNSENRAWAWLGVWMFLFANILMFINIFGDTWGLARHALLSTMVFRLFMWLYIMVLMDIMITSQKTESALQGQ